MKIYVVGGATHYANFIKDAELVDNVEAADIVLFTGGEDVSPMLYGCQKHPTTYNNPNRDGIEKKIFKKIKPNQFCLGICRGSQFLCVMNGGMLVQNCTGHAIGRTHAITNGDMIYQITSTHHQMQYPYNLPNEDYKVLYKSAEPLSDRYEGDKIIPERVASFGEPEIVLYKRKNLPVCLAIQGHPEMIPDSPVANMINNLIKTYVK